MRVLLLLTLAALPAAAIAGCVSVKYREPCAAVRVEPTYDPRAFDILFTNCSSGPILLQRQDCGEADGVGAFVRREDGSGGTWRIRPVWANTSSLRPAEPEACPGRPLLEATTVPPGSTIGRRFGWNGEIQASLRDTPLFPMTGRFLLEAVAISTDGTVWRAFATLDLGGGAGECGRLTLEAEPERAPAGGRFRIEAAFHNCGTESVRLVFGHCDGPLVPVIESMPPLDGPFPYRPGSYALGNGSAVEFNCMADALPRPVAANETLRRVFTWNATLRSGNGTFRPAPDATYGLLVTAMTDKGSVFRAVAEVQLGEGGVRDLVRGSYSGIHDPLLVTVESPQEWAALWERHLANQGCGPPGDRSCLPPPPEVDFTQDRVVAVWAGDKPDGCHSVAMTGWRIEDRRIVAEVAHYVPGPGLACTMAITQPHHAVAIPRDARPVEFEERQEIRRAP